MKRARSEKRVKHSESESDGSIQRWRVGDYHYDHGVGI